jgi:hypothetical protein
MQTADQNDEIKRRIIELQIEHRDLDLAIEALSRRLVSGIGAGMGAGIGAGAALGSTAAVAPAGIDEIGLRRLKKRKLLIKDALTRLQMRLVPDIPA